MIDELNRLGDAVFRDGASAGESLQMCLYVGFLKATGVTGILDEQRQMPFPPLLIRDADDGGFKRFDKSVAVPVQHPDCIAGPHPDSCERGGQTADPFSQFAIREALQVSIDDLLIGGLEKRGMPPMLDDQRVLIGGLCGSGYLARPSVLRTLSQPRGA